MMEYLNSILYLERYGAMHECKLVNRDEVEHKLMKNGVGEIHLVNCQDGAVVGNVVDDSDGLGVTRERFDKMVNGAAIDWRVVFEQE